MAINGASYISRDKAWLLPSHCEQLAAATRRRSPPPQGPRCDAHLAPRSHEPRLPLEARVGTCCVICRRSDRRTLKPSVTQTGRTSPSRASLIAIAGSCPRRLPETIQPPQSRTSVALPVGDAGSASRSSPLVALRRRPQLPPRLHVRGASASAGCRSFVRSRVHGIAVPLHPHTPTTRQALLLLELRFVLIMNVW